MTDSEFIQEGDECQRNPINCENGLSFSIWEKITYEEDILISNKKVNYHLADFHLQD